MVLLLGLTGGIIAQLETQASCLQSMSKSKFATLSDGHEVEQKAARILAVVASDKRNSSCSSACKLLSSWRNSKRAHLFDVTTRWSQQIGVPCPASSLASCQPAAHASIRTGRKPICHTRWWAQCCHLKLTSRLSFHVGNFVRNGSCRGAVRLQEYNYTWILYQAP